MDKQKMEELTSTLCNSIMSDLNQMKDTHKHWLAMMIWSISF